MTVGTISAHSTVVVAGGPVWNGLAGEVAILDLDAETYYGLGAVGAQIWKLIQTPTRVSEVRDAIADEYDVEPARCEQDLVALLEQLVARGLIRVTDAKTP